MALIILTASPVPVVPAVVAPQAILMILIVYLVLGVSVVASAPVILMILMA